MAVTAGGWGLALPTWVSPSPRNTAFIFLTPTLVIQSLQAKIIYSLPETKALCDPLPESSQFKKKK